MVVPDLSVEDIRKLFPALSSGFAFLENAGGSQVPQCLIDAVSQFYVEGNAQTGAGYEVSDRATETVAHAHEVAAAMFGAESFGVAVLGPSTSQLLLTLSDAWSRKIQPGDEVVVSVANHEANIGPWLRLEAVGAVIKWWDVDSTSGESSISELERLLSSRTKIVSFPHTSNLLGNVADVERITHLAHSAGARVVVDGVAYAPHRQMSVAAWGVDYYAFSFYKTFGPHMAAMYGRSDALAELEGPNHYFVPNEELPRKFELGCLSFEGCAAVVALETYFKRLTGANKFDRSTLQKAFERIRTLEAELTTTLISYFKSKNGVRVIGPIEGDRVPTVSFVSSKSDSQSVAQHVNRSGVGIRCGHMYSHRLTKSLGVAPDPGVVRVSAVHYNTVEEIRLLIRLLDEVI